MQGSRFICSNFEIRDYFTSTLESQPLNAYMFKNKHTLCRLKSDTWVKKIKPRQTLMEKSYLSI